MFDPEQFADAVAQAIETATSPLLARIAVLERQKSAEPVRGEPGAKGADGRDADMTLVLDLRREIESLRGELALVKSAPSWLIDESGELVAAQNGQLQKLGRVRGRDAQPVVVDVESIAQKAAGLIPRPKDGANGKDAPTIDVETVAKRAAELVPRPVDGKDAVVDLDVVALKAAALVPAPKNGHDGASVRLEDVLPHVQAAVVKAVADLPKPRDGRDVELVTVQTLVAAEVVKAVSGLPPAKDGASVGVADVEPLIRAEVTKAVALIPAPKDGVSVTLDDVEPLVRAEVQKAVASLPAPAVAVQASDIEPIVRAEVVKAVAAITPASPPVGIVGSVTDRAGHLILTLSNGSTLDAGEVVGRDGASVDMHQVMEHVTKTVKDEVSKIPRPVDGKDGRDGRDGVDGFTVDDLTFVYDDTRKGCFARFTKGERVKEDRLSGVMVYCGLYEDGQEYFKGNVVSCLGAGWISQADHVKGVKPGDTPESRKVWRLLAMRGKDGKQGPQGPIGKDLRWEPPSE